MHRTGHRTASPTPRDLAATIGFLALSLVPLLLAILSHVGREPR